MYQNILSIQGDLVTVKITKGFETTITLDDIVLCEYRWSASVMRDSCYVVRCERFNGSKHSLFLHRAILQRVLGRKLLPSEIVDHKDGNPLNNRRDNLRLATKVDNQRNSRKPKNNTSGYKGVYKHAGRWVAMIRTNENKKHLGRFDTPEEAYEAYCEAAKKYHGEFARLE